MKKIVFTLTMLLAMGAMAVAQDTIFMRGQQRDGYFYYTDYDRFCGNPSIALCISGEEFAKYFYTEDSLTVYGIAIGIKDGLEYKIQMGVDPTRVIHDTSYANAYEYLRIYRHLSYDLQCIKQIKVHLHTSPIAYYADYTTSTHPNEPQIVSMYERYFASPVVLTDSFYVGMTHNTAKMYTDSLTGEYWDNTYIPLYRVSLNNGSMQVGDWTMFYSYKRWFRFQDKGCFNLIFPILLPPDSNYVYDTTVVAGDSIMVGDTVIVCDTVIIGGDTIVQYDTLLALPERGLLGRMVGVMPNPAAETAKVVSSFGLTAVEVFNTAGERIHTLRLPDAPLTATLDVRRWPAGTYLLRIHTPQGTTVRKLIKK